MSYAPNNTIHTASASLPRYTGTWDRAAASHLLRRTVYGPRIDEIDKAHADGLDRTLDLILGSYSIPSPPVKYRRGDDDAVSLGETWVNAPYINKPKFRAQSLKGWYFNTVILEEKTSIRDRMAFFWLNYFAIHGPGGDHRSMYSHLRLYQEQATGNLRTMLRKITVQPRMLTCLDGVLNNKENPNENFARELMELYTVGKGQIIGHGDYTTFTEKDVVALARALTGWVNHDFAYSSNGSVPVAAKFDSSRHDTGNKQMSYHFGNRVITNSGRDEYKEVIDILLESENAARHFCRRLYRYFVYYDINDDVESRVIGALAQTLMANDYEIKPVLRQLFSSEHFYHSSFRGSIIKNPIDLLCSSLRPFREYQHHPVIDLLYRYELGDKYAGYCYDLQLDPLEPPAISGWDAYHLAPQYHRHWISPALMQGRHYLVARQVTHRYFHINNNRLKLDYYSFLDGLTDPEDVDAVLDDIITIFLPRPVSETQYTKLKFWLMKDDPDSTWAKQARGFLNNPNDAKKARLIEDRFRDFFESFFGMAEFHLQ